MNDPEAARAAQAAVGAAVTIKQKRASLPPELQELFDAALREGMKQMTLLCSVAVHQLYQEYTGYRLPMVPHQEVIDRAAALMQEQVNLGIRQHKKDRSPPKIYAKVYAKVVRLRNDDKSDRYILNQLLADKDPEMQKHGGKRWDLNDVKQFLKAARNAGDVGRRRPPR
jgi:hypothetical protein